jgi:hypothetical protein
MFELIGQLKELFEKYKPAIEELIPKLDPAIKKFQADYQAQTDAIKRIEQKYDVDSQAMLSMVTNTGTMVNLLAAHFGIASPVLPPIASLENEITQPVALPPALRLVERQAVGTTETQDS